jgi:hypothetical protein
MVHALLKMCTYTLLRSNLRIHVCNFCMHGSSPLCMALFFSLSLKTNITPLYTPFLFLSRQSGNCALVVGRRNHQCRSSKQSDSCSSYLSSPNVGVRHFAGKEQQAYKRPSGGFASSVSLFRFPFTFFFPYPFLFFILFLSSL